MQFLEPFKLLVLLRYFEGLDGPQAFELFVNKLLALYEFACFLRALSIGAQIISDWLVEPLALFDKPLFHEL
jgi:hypothetical protein